MKQTKDKNWTHSNWNKQAKEQKLNKVIKDIIGDGSGGITEQEKWILVT
jgi:hypothetical protein